MFDVQHTVIACSQRVGPVFSLSSALTPYVQLGKVEHCLLAT